MDFQRFKELSIIVLNYYIAALSLDVADINL